MSITPIEMYSIAPKSQEASNVRHAEQVKLADRGAEAVQTTQKKAEESTHRTNQAGETGNNEYRYDAKEKGNGSYSSNGNAKKEDKKDDSQGKGRPENMSTRPGGIDIRV